VKRSRLIWSIGVIAGLGVVLATLWIARSSNLSQMTVINNASEDIASVSVRVSGQEVVIVNLGRDRTALREHKVYGDSGYQIAVRFASGREMNATDGYVTNGLSFKATITVTDDEIRLKML
jgi:hypothetical protein